MNHTDIISEGVRELLQEYEGKEATPELLDEIAAKVTDAIVVALTVITHTSVKPSGPPLEILTGDSVGSVLPPSATYVRKTKT